jgi:hypothetical protein
VAISEVLLDSDCHTTLAMAGWYFKGRVIKGKRLITLIS